MLDNTDKEAENGVISAIFNHGNEAFLDVSDLVGINSFTDDLNQIIYKVAEFHYKNTTDNLDMPSFLSYCNSMGFNEIINKPKVIEMVRNKINSNIDLKSARRLSFKIRNLEITRNYKKQLDEAKVKLSSVTGEESLSEIISLVEQGLFDFTAGLATHNQSGPKKIFEDIEDYLDYLESNPIQQIGIPSGFPLYDLAIGGGLRRKTVNLIGARAKIGKSAICANSANFNIQNGIPTYFGDTELSAEDQKHRMLACISGVPYPLIETGKYANSMEMRKKVREAGSILKDSPYYYENISGMPFEDFVCNLRRWITKDVGYKDGTTKPCLIIYDYIKLMTDTTLKNLQEFQALGFLMTTLHNFMVKYDCPCLATIQLNRDGINREDTDVAAGSDRLVWLCSNFTLLKKQSEEEIAMQRELGVRELYNRKMLTLAARHGPGSLERDYINVRFQGDICRLTEGPLQSELSSSNENGGFESESIEPF